MHQAYQLAAEEPGVIVLDMPVYKPCEQGLPTDAKVLVTNDGKNHGSLCKARRIIGDEGIDEVELLILHVMQCMIAAIKEWIAAHAIVGLDKNLLLVLSFDDSKDPASTLYSWIMNFKFFDAAVKNSTTIV